MQISFNINSISEMFAAKKEQLSNGLKNQVKKANDWVDRTRGKEETVRVDMRLFREHWQTFCKLTHEYNAEHANDAVSALDFDQFDESSIDGLSQLANDIKGKDIN